jgi:signal transduction histidine kinase/ligand-binding sensor domain-containing protein/CheY-like chemotaxis protein/AraC-like DNA-binding protein
MMNTRMLLSFFSLIYALILPVQSAGHFFNQYNFKFITESNGLPYNFVSDILKDSEGYVWVATHYGIGRYDGYEFLNYGVQTEPVRLKNDFVHKICEDNFRRLWIASEGGIDILDLNTYALAEPPLPPDSLLRQLMNEYVSTIYKDKQGHLWISSNKDLWCIELDNKGNIKDYYCLKNVGASPVHAILDLGWAVCAGIDNEVCRIEKQPPHLLKAAILSDSLVSFSEDWRISCMQADGDLLWIGSNRGLFKYNHAERNLKRYRYSTHRSGMLSQAYITDVKLTERGQLIVSTLNGLNVYHRDTDTFSFIRQTSERNGVSINCNAINCLFTDRETIWLGTETGGINLLSPKRLHTELWSCEAYAIDTGAPTSVNTVDEDKDGNLWIGLVEHGLIKWDRENNACTHHLFSPNDITSISNNTIKGILVDADSYLWAYTWGVHINGLDLNIPNNRTFKRYTRENIPGLEGDFISSACEDRINQGIWFGSTQGIHFYDKRKDTFTKVLFDRSDNEFEAIHALLIDRKKRLWVGTTQGVFIVDLHSFAESNKSFDYEYLKYKLDNPESTQLEKINSILEDSNGTLWLGGNGSGLYRLTSDKNNHFVFKNYTTGHGLPNNTVTGMAEDGQDNLWLTTNDGVSRLNIRSMTFSNYTQADGLPATQFYRNGIHYSAKHDCIYLATIDGLVIIHADKEALPPAHVQVKLSSLAIGGNIIYPSNGKYLKEHITRASGISLHEKDNRFSIGFTTQDYGNSSRIRFAYRLEGYEEEWNETPPGNYTARYTAVSSGNYRLQVCATDELGHWSDEVTEIEVSITPYFYKSGWFYLSLVIAIFLGIYVFYQRKTQVYRERQAQLEQKVEQRTQELAVQNRQLEAMAQHVREITEEKIAFFTNITHEFRTPVTLIHGPIEHALKETRDEGVKTQLQIAERNSRYLLSLVNELMDFRKLDMNKVVLDKRPVNFTDFLTELLLPFKVFAEERNIDIHTCFRLDNPFLVIDPAYIRKVMVNLISNAIKFTPDNGQIRIYIASVKAEDGDKMLYINVCDTGYGLVTEDMKKIFDRFFQSKEVRKYPVYSQSGTGIGLFLCSKIVELHGGEIWARNNHTRGASFRILMPLIPGESDEQPVTGQEAVQPGYDLTDISQPADTPKKETILIVEDNKDMRSYIRMLLVGDYRLFEAGNGKEALQIVQKHTIDLIVSDLMMPVMDGMELSRHIKKNLATSHIPFLMLTAIRSEFQEKRSFEIGVDEYLCKPFDEEVFRLRIRNILNLRSKYKKMFSSSSNIEELHIQEESRDKTFITTAINLMKENYADSEYNLERFVRDMRYSKTLVNTKMHDLTGQPIGQFMKNYRLNVARKMLREGPCDINVSEIAYAVGFNDPKYFTKCFKEFFGYLPSSKLKR